MITAPHSAMDDYHYRSRLLRCLRRHLSFTCSSAGLMLLFAILASTFWTGISPRLSPANLFRPPPCPSTMPVKYSYAGAASSTVDWTVSLDDGNDNVASDPAAPGLTYDFYSIVCPSAEAIINDTVASIVHDDPFMAAALLRMAFHDCFVQGCDASVLLLSDEDGGAPERSGVPNSDSLRGFEVLDKIKGKLEEACPYTVSCADIVVLAARDAVVESGGPYYNLAKGRRDGRKSSSALATDTLPRPSFNISEMKKSFYENGFNDTDIVSLLGSHTIGLVRCKVLKARMDNFTSGMPDYHLNITLFVELETECNKSSFQGRLSLNPGKTEQRFDNSYFKNILLGSGSLEVDQALMDDPTTSSLVRAYSEDQHLFFEDFQRSMVKMSNLAVLTGNEGEIRRNCSLQI